MVDGSERKILNLGSGNFSQVLASKGHRVFTVDKQIDRLTALVNTERITPVAAQPEALPFHPCQYDAVTVHQSFHLFAPGMVLSEIARVLKPGGYVSVSYLVRDDSVPWVKRLATLVQSVNPEAMTASFGIESVEHLLTSKYFPNVDHKAFRIWVPVSREQMLEMAKEATKSASEIDQERLLANVGSLYDEYSSGIDDLKLPYQLRCWKAWVDHEELTAPIEIDDTGLVIPI